MKRYTALTCWSDRGSLDVILAFSSSLPTTGIADNDDHIVFYLEEEDFSEATLEAIRSWLPDSAAIEFEEGTLEEQNWNAEFERSLEPVRVAEDLIFTQSWNPVAPSHSGELVIVIDPKMSFGTGHHESTRLISRLMMRLDLAGKRVLDVGTGTGVLAVIAAKKGAAEIIAIDNNEWAVENAIENLPLNDVPADTVDIRLCEIDDVPEGPFDVILANIHRNIIIELLPAIMRKFPDGEGLLLTSGVLYVDYDSLVDAAAEHGLTPLAEERENDWIATTWKRIENGGN